LSLEITPASEKAPGRLLVGSVDEVANMLALLLLPTAASRRPIFLEQSNLGTLDEISAKAWTRPCRLCLTNSTGNSIMNHRMLASSLVHDALQHARRLPQYVRLYYPHGARGTTI